MVIIRARSSLLFEEAKQIKDGPVIVHALTTKGKGFPQTEPDYYRWHATGPFDLKTGKPHKSSSKTPTYTKVFGDTLAELMEKDPKVVALTARPALFVGLYAGARGGEVILTVPERTACYLCATRSRHEVERAGGRVAREVDYGTGRLQGEIALGADIHHVATAAVKLALSLLLPAGSEAGLRAFAEDVLASGMPYLTLSTVPAYWFYPQVFGETPGQGAYQGVWLTPRRSADCPVCGPPAARVDPLCVPLRAPTRAGFAEALRDESAQA